MSFVSKFLGNITGANQQANAASAASATQAASAQAGIDEQQREFNAYQQVLAPYVQAGTGALTGQQNLLGLNGGGAQSSAISALQTSPQYQALSQAGQDAILANASATGGLRGGNVQSSLAQFQPALLSSLIQQQLQGLGGLTTIGQNSAAGVGSAGLQTGSNIANLLQQQGAATAGGQIAQGSTTANTFGTLLKLGSAAAGAYGFGAPGIGSAGATPAMIGAGQF